MLKIIYILLHFFSPKLKHKSYKNNLSFFKIYNTRTKQNFGIIRFTDMIPVPKKYVHLLNIKELSYNYKRLCCNYKTLEEKSLDYKETIKV